MTKGLLIDPAAETVTEVECNTKTLDAAYALLDCSLVEMVHLPNGDVMLLDEEGMVRPYRRQGHFTLLGADQPFVGRALVLRERGGGFAAPKITVVALRAALRFLTDDVAATMRRRMGYGFDLA